MAIIIGDATPEILFGTSERDTIRGGGGGDTIYGLAGADLLYGETGNDTIEGGDGNDLIDGGAGSDKMRGQAGNDVYVVASVGDRVVETVAGAAGGSDSVFASIAYTLGANVENLYLVGLAGSGTGNGLANVITGNAHSETLYGLAGSDTLIGKAGDDLLEGGSGADRMDGGEGDDSYYVDNPGDSVVDRFGGVRGGHDIVYSAVDFALVGNVEDLTLLASARRGEGNGFSNRIVGNDGDNLLVGWQGDDFLEGGAGADRLNGGAGKDTAVFQTDRWNPYELYDAPRVVADLAAGVVHWELSSEPADQLISIESIATGDGNDRITGSDGVNVISPGRGANLVDAGGGDDVIQGGTWSGSGAFGGEPGDPSGSEILRGGAGNDVIYGNGNALLSSGPSWLGGIDVLDGGPGDDRLVAGLLTASFGRLDNRLWDGNLMTGGDGADRFEFSDDTELYSFHFPSSAGTGATVTDFDRSEGDKLVFDVEDPSSAVFVGETHDIGVGECGFYRSGGDTFVKYGILMEWSQEIDDYIYLVPVAVKLEDYSGPVTASDVLFV